MSLLPVDSPLVRSIRYEDLQSYLGLRGWKTARSPNSSWEVYEGPNDVSGEPLEIVLIKNGTSRKAYEYYASAISLLAALNEETPVLTAQRIQNVDRDVFNVRNIREENSISIPLKLAAKQVSRLQTLIRQAANSERDALPYFRTDHRPTLADKMTQQFHFGHTERRSFGLSILSPQLVQPTPYKQIVYNFENQITEILEPIAPVGRRIMERIVRGLQATKVAVRTETVDTLVQSYLAGFNANMCRAIIDISPNETATVEYSVLWSLKVPPPDDLANASPVLLNETDYKYLEQAERAMKELEVHDTVVVRGLVLGLSSTDDPHKLNVGQSIVVNWERPDTGQPVKLYVELKSEDYIEAVDAHKNWLPVMITGEARLIGNRWRLFNARDFRVV